ncbi:penicillin V acylase-like isoform X2 [Acropora muricata]
MKILIVVQLLFCVFPATNACSEIRVTAEDKSVIVGRTSDYGKEMFSNVVVEPEGYSHVAVPAVGCSHHEPLLSWQSKYAVAYLNGWDQLLPADGMNSAGLSVSSLMLRRFTKYQDVPPDKCGQAVSQLEFGLWLLGTFSTVQEVRKSMSEEWFPLVFPREFRGYLFELHFSVVDKSGDAIVIEYTEQGRKVYKNTLGVMTNAPTYDSQMLNIRNYIELSKYERDPLELGADKFPAFGAGSGLLGMPGDFTPPSRFVRLLFLKEFATQPKTNEEAVNLAFHLLNSVDIPVGVVSVNKTHPDSGYTQWTVAKDLTNNALYFRDYNDTTIRGVYLDKVQQGQVMQMKAYGPVTGFKDVTGELKPVYPNKEEL